MFKRSRASELLAVGLLSLSWFAIGWLVHGFIVRQNSQGALIEEVQDLLVEQSLKEVPSREEMTYNAIRVMLQEIDDPYAAFLAPEVAGRWQDVFTGQSGIIGVNPARQDEHFVVSAVRPDSSAETAGLRAGDILISVDEIEMDPLMTRSDVALLLRGPINTAAHVTVQRGDELLDFKPLRREESIVSEGNILDGDVAYVAQHVFTSNSPDEIGAILDGLVNEDPSAFIWDLRDNGGGSMEALQQILSFFIADGVLFVAEMRDGETVYYEASAEHLKISAPIIVLTGPNTVSAAETAASAIQERGRGILIGETTYGKGTIQSTIPLAQRSALQFTIARWLSPSGNWYDGRGVQPNIYMPNNPETTEDETLAAAVTYAKDNWANQQTILRDLLNTPRPGATTAFQP